MPRMRCEIWTALAVILIVLASPARAQGTRTPVPASVSPRADVLGQWENVTALALGMPLRVTLADDTRVAGTLQVASADRLVIQTKGDTGSVACDRDQVTRVEQRRGPRIRSGAGWGALVGGLIGAITLGAIEPKDARTTGVLFWHEIPVMATATAIGAGTGSVLNAAMRRWVVVYQRS